MNIKPLNERILLKIKKIEEKTAGGIYIPESAQEKTNEAEVVAIGNGGNVTKSGIKVGDIVMYESYGGTEIKEKQTGNSLLLVKYDDVIAIVN